MPNRQVANLQFNLGTVSSAAGSSGTGWVSLGVPFSIFHLQAIQSISTGTFAGTLYGNTSSGGTTGNSVALCSVDNSTTHGYNSSAVPCSFLNFVSSGNPSTGGNTVAIAVACAG